ncbi:MAG: helix-turn-helix transcriptional regulator [Nanoarchaeota archaeon]|nr:helix-turn-helix transcriptional regulator [Nanoarchaeota archaeon]
MEVHIYQLPLKRNYIILNEEFNDALLNKLIQAPGTIANASRLSGISKSVLGRYLRKERKRIRIDFLLKIICFLNIPLQETEKNICWIGANNSQGITNPQLPFVFNTRASARFLAAICNDGWISDGLYYSNSSKELRDSVKEDALSVFGGDEDTIKEWVKEKDQYLSFPSIMRDVLVLITDFKGVKSENNPPVPPFILEDRNLICGWVEQTIADEGHIAYRPDKYRREIIWRRSFSKNLNEYKLNRDERRMLNKIGIEYDVKNIGMYKTSKGIEKIRLHMRIAKRENVCKLRKLIKIPHPKKDKTFTEMTKNFKRYKEPSRVKNIIIKICKEKDYITTRDLANSTNYKRINNVHQWLSKYVKEGLLVCIQKHYHKNGHRGRIHTKYTLNRIKSQII